jgi:hypothetical protein
MQKNENRASFHTIYIINSTRIKDLNIRTKPIKLPEKIWENLHDVGLGKYFLDMTPKA